MDLEMRDVKGCSPYQAASRISNKRASGPFTWHGQNENEAMEANNEILEKNTICTTSYSVSES